MYFWQYILFITLPNNLTYSILKTSSLSNNKLENLYSKIRFGRFLHKISFKETFFKNTKYIELLFSKKQLKNKQHILPIRIRTILNANT